MAETNDGNGTIICTLLGDDGAGNQCANTTVTGDGKITMKKCASDPSEEDTKFSIDESILFAGGADWCANFLTGFIKATALQNVFDAIVKGTTKGGDLCFVAQRPANPPAGTNPLGSIEQIAESNISQCAGGNITRGAKPGGNLVSKAMPGGNVMQKAGMNMDGMIINEAANGISNEVIGSNGGGITGVAGSGVPGGVPVPPPGTPGPGPGGSIVLMSGAGGEGAPSGTPGASNNGASGGEIILEAGPGGQAADNVSGAMPGQGGAVNVIGGAGGAAPILPGTVAPGGAGGDVNVSGGGGSPSTGTSGGGIPGGTGGGVAISGGPGGEDQTSAPANNGGGSGGGVTIAGGPGAPAGAPSGAPPGGPVSSPGPGGGITITGGAGGSIPPGSSPVGGVTPNAPGGTVTISGGSPGTSGGSGGSPIGSGGDVNICTMDGGSVMIESQGDDGCIMLCAGMTKVEGNLCVTGDSSSINTETVNVEDNCIYLNNGYETPVGMGGCVVFNYLPTTNCANIIQDPLSSGNVFVPGQMGISNPVVYKDSGGGSSTFGPGDIVQIAGASNPANDGIYEVLSDTGLLLTIKGIGLVATTVSFVKNQFAATNAAAAPAAVGKITQVNVLSIGSSSSGDFITQCGDNTSSPGVVDPNPVVSCLVPGNGIQVDDVTNGPSKPILSVDFTANAGDGISIVNTPPGSADITITNTGVLAVEGGDGISISGGQDERTISNTGVLAVEGEDGISVSGGQDDRVIRNDSGSKTHASYHFYRDTSFCVDFGGWPTGSPDPFSNVDQRLWDVPATLYESNNIDVVSDGILRYTGSRDITVKIDWFVEGDLNSATMNANSPFGYLIYIYKNNDIIRQSLRRSFASELIDTVCVVGFPVVVNEERVQRTESQATGSFVVRLEENDEISLRASQRPRGVPVSDLEGAELFNYSITITEL